MIGPGTQVPQPRQPVELRSTVGVASPGPRRPGRAATVLTLVVSILALGVSGVALYLTERNHTVDQMTLDRQRLTSLQDSWNTVEQGQDSDDQFEVGTIRPYINEALILIKRLNGTSAAASPFEKIRIAGLLVRAQEPLLAADLAADAEAQSVGLSLSERANSARALGSAQMAANQVEAGRASMARALVYVDQDDGSHDRLILANTRFTTQIKWSVSELRLANCDEARVHLSAARGLIADFPPAYRGQPTERVVAREKVITKACSGE